MSPAQLAKLECANWINGICLGAMLNKDLSQWMKRELAGRSCIVGCKRCPYFESVLIPQVRMSPNHPYYKAMLEAVTKYEVKYFEKVVLRHCRQCKKAVPGMKKNQKYCPVCAKRRKSKATRESKRLKRQKSG